MKTDFTKTIATLGPAGTFSDQAAKQYLREFGDVKQISTILYFKSIKSAFKAVGNDAISASC